jgi:hypothetical protein
MWRRGEERRGEERRGEEIEHQASNHSVPQKIMPIRRGKCACQALAGTGACVQPIMKGIHLVFERGVLFSLRPFRCGLAEKTFGRAQN